MFGNDVSKSLRLTFLGHRVYIMSYERYSGVCVRVWMVRLLVDGTSVRYL